MKKLWCNNNFSANGNAIPQHDTYTINNTENRLYKGASRSVSILDVTIIIPDYITSLIYVYDTLSGMLLEATSETTTQSQNEPTTSKYSYSVVETNISALLLLSVSHLSTLQLLFP